MADELPDTDFDSDLDDAGLGDGSATPESSAGKSGGLLSIKSLAGIGIVVAVAAGLSVLCVSLVAGEGTSASEAAADAEKRDGPDLGDLSKKKVFKVDDLIVNLAGDRARRLLTLTIRLEISSERLMEALENADNDYYQVKLRDKLITLLSAKTLDDIEKPDSKTRIRREIRDELNMLFNTNDGIQHVYFTDFMVQ